MRHLVANCWQIIIFLVADNNKKIGLLLFADSHWLASPDPSVTFAEQNVAMVNPVEAAMD